MDNILNSLMKLISPRLVSSVSKAVGAPEGNVSKGLTGIIPVFLTGIMNKGDSPQQLSSMSEMFKQVPSMRTLSAGDNNQFKALTGNSEVSSLSGSFMKTVLGDKSSNAFGLLSQFSGLNSQATSSIAKIAAPVVMGFFGSKLRQGVPMSDMVSSLKSQKAEITKMLPGGMGQLFEQSNNPKVNLSTTKPINRPRWGWLKWLMGLIILLLGLSWFLRSCSPNQLGSMSQPNVSAPNLGNIKQKAQDHLSNAASSIKQQTNQALSQANTAANSVASQANTATSSVASQANTAVSQTNSALGNFLTTNLPDNVQLNIPSSGTESKLLAFIKDSSLTLDKATWFSFDRLTFETGSAQLNSSSMEQLKNIAAILKAYPNVNIKIGGYTDNVGDEAANIQLSQARADAVRQNLINLGIGSARITAKGYGEMHPVATNDTPAGRAQNRRIDILVTQK